MAEIETALLQAVHENDAVEDTGEFALSLGVDHTAVFAVVQSLLSHEMVATNVCWLRNLICQLHVEPYGVVIMLMLSLELYVLVAGMACGCVFVLCMMRSGAICCE